MFSSEFFPTPRAVAHRMMRRVSKDVEYILEPSAGKGDLAEVARGDVNDEEAAQFDDIDEQDQYMRRRKRSYRSSYSDRGHRKVDVIELNPELTSILREKDFQLVGYDWLDYSGVSYYHAIVMNPPFSNGDEHLLKAWDFLHSGEIVCLLNEETIKNPYTERRQRLAQIIAEHGDVEYLGDCFSTAERKTDVRVVMVYLKKEAEDDSFELWGAKVSDEKPVDVSSMSGEDAMLAIRDELGNMEHFYNQALQHFIDAFGHIRKAKIYLDGLGLYVGGSGQRERSYGDILELGFKNLNEARYEVQRKLRRDGWMHALTHAKFHKWLDKKQTEQLLRDVERDATLPFTAENIKATLENVFLNRRKLFEISVANCFDELTRYFAGNTTGAGGGGNYSGWKTNDNYKVNERLVFPYGCRYDKDFNSFRHHYGGDMDIYCDLDRIVCVLDGRDFSACYTIDRALSKAFDLKHHSVSTQVADSQYFEIRFFKKGTVHLKWKRRDLWEKFNKTAAAGRKWLGANTRGDGVDAETETSDASESTNQLTLI